MSNEVFDDVVFDFMADYPSTITYTKNTDGAYDPATGSVSTTSQTWTLNAIAVDLQSSQNGVSTRFGTEIQTGDKELYVQPPQKADPTASPLTDINPATDSILLNGKTYNIVAYREMNPTGNDPILFDLYIRR